MNILSAILLGFIQGITEFLPVSSSGHLVIFQSLFGLKEGDLFFDTVLHLGTALAVMIVFKKDIIELLRSIFKKDKEGMTYLFYLIIATIPAAFVGVFFDDFLETFFGKPSIIGAMLIVTSLILFLSAIKRNSSGKLTIWKVVIIGLAQAVAIIPGISRSGSTIAAALLVGVSREEAGRFSFILALPAILGAVLLQSVKIEKADINIIPVISGFIISFISGIIALKFLLKFVKSGKLYVFGFYCLAIGILSLIFFL